MGVIICCNINVIQLIFLQCSRVNMFAPNLLYPSEIVLYPSKKLKLFNLVYGFYTLYIIRVDSKILESIGTPANSFQRSPSNAFRKENNWAILFK